MKTEHSLDIFDHFNQEEITILQKVENYPPNMRSTIVDKELAERIEKFKELLLQAKKEHWYY